MGTGGLVVVGASAGGVEALCRFVHALPDDLDAPVLVVLHVRPDRPSHLAKILDRIGPLPATTAEHGEILRRGVIYTAPPNHHLLVLGGTVTLSSDPPELGHRPAVNPLFRSAASPHTLGVVLSGLLNDGAAGLATIREAGGTTLVQDPDDAQHPGMPRNAIRAAQPDYIATAAELGRLAGTLARRPVTEASPSTDRDSEDASA